MNPKVDAYIRRIKIWKEETERLRKILLGCHLCEELKWGKPCYTFEQSNIVIIQGFKAYLALMFFKGVLLKDPKGILKKIGENSRVGRQIRFNGLEEIEAMEPTLKAYIREAVEVERAGLKVVLEDRNDLKIPEELQNKFAKMPALKIAFEALTPGRQRGYILHFAQAKQSKTRASRIEKWAPQILKGKGMND